MLRNKCKLARRLTTNMYDDQVDDLIRSALADLRQAGISAEKTGETTNDPLVTQAVITYFLMHFGAPANYDQLKASYDEQKAQLMSATGYGLEGESSES